MEAKDTVMHSKDCAWHGCMTGGSLGDKKYHYACTCGREAQAEISFKAGGDEVIRRLQPHLQAITKEAREEVVEWFEENIRYKNSSIAEWDTWRAQLKEWGVA